MEVDLDAILPVMLAVAEQAGALVLSIQAAGLAQITSKSNQIDLVTEADLACEKLIRSELRSHYPSFDFWGEESNEPPTSDYYWVVDPIDGTTNFANAVPYYAINIALVHGALVHGALVRGALDQMPTILLGVTLELPARNLFYAHLGHGAYLRTPDGRETRLRVNQVATLGQAFLTTGFPYHRTDYEDNNLAEFAHFLTRCQGVRCMGSAAMDLVNVARGSSAGYWEGWLSAWDAAPGVLLLREAGGQVTDYLGRPWLLTSRSLIASNGQPSLHAALVDGIQTARQGLTSPKLPASELG